MYAVLLTFSDDPARLELRPGHREKLAAHVAADRLVAAGPWADDSGALLVFAVKARADVDEILADDPYYAAPGVGVTVQEWNVVSRHPALDVFWSALDPGPDRGGLPRPEPGD